MKTNVRPKRAKQYPPELVDKVSELYRVQGLTVEAVVKTLGLSRNVVRRVMLNHGIAVRESWERASTTPAQGGFNHPGAYCKGMDPDIFFPDSARGRRRAADICRSHCVVMEGCLTYAMTAHETDGVWGGCSESERAELARRWDGHSPLVRECRSCERGFVSLIDGSGQLCARCRTEADAQRIA